MQQRQMRGRRRRQQQQQGLEAQQHRHRCRDDHNHNKGHSPTTTKHVTSLATSAAMWVVQQVRCCRHPSSSIRQASPYCLQPPCLRFNRDRPAVAGLPGRPGVHGRALRPGLAADGGLPRAQGFRLSFVFFGCRVPGSGCRAWGLKVF